MSGSSGDQKPKPGKKKSKMSTDDVSRAFGIAAGVISVAAIAVFILFQLIPERDGTEDMQGTPWPTAANIENPGTEIELDWDKDATPMPTGFDPFNRPPGSIADDNGENVADKTTPASGGTRYWIRSKDSGAGRQNMFKITIPAGYQARDMGDGIAVEQAESAATGDAPITFYWQKDTETKNLVSFGYYDYLEHTNTQGFLEYGVKAIGYYLFDDGYGDEYPVITAEYRRIAENDETGFESYVEYRIIVVKKDDANRYLVGSIDNEAWPGLASLAYPDITAFAKALFPQTSDPGFPDGWKWAAGTGNAE